MTLVFQPGDLVRARGREWVVLADTASDLLKIRPLGGLDDEVTGILPALELVEPATFAPPSLADLGDHGSGRLLLEAARLSTRAASGPFRSFGRIAVEPRPYQLVPLMMALRQDTTRLLIADDVGIGKTVEACLIAKELMERGDADGLVVLCPAHLAEQWKDELREKFHIEAQLLLPSTAGRLERGCAVGESVFRRHRHLVVSLDYIKSRRRIDDFVQHCPNLVIVDEAHACSSGSGTSRQQRHALVSRLAADETRHLLLVTATPHSGKEDAFRSLVGMLDPRFDVDFEDLDEGERKNMRSRLAPYLVQRRRGDIATYLSATEFPTRIEREVTYSLTSEYRALLDEVLKFAGAMVEDKSGTRREHRVRWWSALALLRALSSSPAAAAATMRKRADNLEAELEEDIDDIGRRMVLDQDEGEQEEVSDLTPGGEIGEALSVANQRKLRDMAVKAEALCGTKADQKLQDFGSLVEGVLKDGYHPIVFCRFIDTAEYVANHLRDSLKGVEVIAVTGRLVPEERVARIEALGGHPRRVLVCTDCLSEGVNLQDSFDAVLHYDLSWNPTRHEQREGRVDRFGQKKPEVRVLTYHGKDNLIDVVVLRVLHRKARAIRGALGVSIAVPRSTSEVIEELYEAVLREMRGDRIVQQSFDWGGEAKLHEEWEARAEKVSRSIYAQATIRPEEVERELQMVQSAIGSGPEVGAFFRRTFQGLGVPLTAPAADRIDVHLTPEAPRSLRSAIGRSQPFRGRFALPTAEGELYLSRTHPVVEGLASWVLDTALDPETRGGRPALASRCGAAKVREVTERTNLLLLRIRYHLHPQGRRKTPPMLAEDVVPVAYTGSSAAPVWLTREQAEELQNTTVAANIPNDFARQQVESLLAALPRLEAPLAEIARNGAAALADAHSRVRAAARIASGFEVEPVLPVDVLGAYVLLPA